MRREMIERRYALRRVGAGDYLLLGNDGRSLYRFVRYVDGPSHGLTEMKRDRFFWSVWRWRGRALDGGRLTVPDDLEWSADWVESATMLRSRSEAISWTLS